MRKAKAAKEAEASKKQLPSQVLLLPAKRLEVRRGFRLCFELGFQQVHFQNVLVENSLFFPNI